jgi:hypothetical protein
MRAGEPARSDPDDGAGAWAPAGAGNAPAPARSLGLLSSETGLPLDLHEESAPLCSVGPRRRLYDAAVGRGSSNSGKLGKKAPNLQFRWGPVTTYNANGEVVSVEGPSKEPSAFKPRKRRRR